MLLKAVREVLSLRTPQELERLNKPQSSGATLRSSVKWLNTSSTSMSPGGRSLPRNQGARVYERRPDEEAQTWRRPTDPDAGANDVLAGPGQMAQHRQTGVTDPSRRNQPPSDRVDRGSFGTSGRGAGGVPGMEQKWCNRIGSSSLPEDVLPRAAEELLTALVQKTEGTRLPRAYDSYINDVDHQPRRGQGISADFASAASWMRRQVRPPPPRRQSGNNSRSKWTFPSCNPADTVQGGRRSPEKIGGAPFEYRGLLERCDGPVVDRADDADQHRRAAASEDGDRLGPSGERSYPRGQADVENQG